MYDGLVKNESRCVLVVGAAAGASVYNHDSISWLRERRLAMADNESRPVVLGGHAPYMSEPETWHHVSLEFLGKLK